MISKPTPIPSDFTLATTDLLSIYKEDPEAALNLMQALLLSRMACSFRRAMLEALGNPPTPTSSVESQRILKQVSEWGAIKAVLEDRIQFEELEQLTRHPAVLEELHRLVTKGTGPEPEIFLEETVPHEASVSAASWARGQDTKGLRDQTKPTGFVELYQKGSWNDLHSRLSKTRILDEIVAWMGWPADDVGRLREDLLRSLPIESQKTDNFWTALNHCLRGFACQSGLDSTKTVRPEDWRRIVERAVLREVLEEQTEDSIPWQVAFKNQVYSDVLPQENELLTRMLTLELPAEYGKPAWFQDFRMGLVHRIRDRWKTIDIEGAV